MSEDGEEIDVPADAIEAPLAWLCEPHHLAVQEFARAWLRLEPIEAEEFRGAFVSDLQQELVIAHRRLSDHKYEEIHQWITETFHTHLIVYGWIKNRYPKRWDEQLHQFRWGKEKPTMAAHIKLGMHCPQSLWLALHSIKRGIRGNLTEEQKASVTKPRNVMGLVHGGVLSADEIPSTSSDEVDLPLEMQWKRWEKEALELHQRYATDRLMDFVNPSLEAIKTGNSNFFRAVADTLDAIPARSIVEETLLLVARDYMCATGEEPTKAHIRNETVRRLGESAAEGAKWPRYWERYGMDNFPQGKSGPRPKKSPPKKGERGRRTVAVPIWSTPIKQWTK